MTGPSLSRCRRKGSMETRQERLARRPMERSNEGAADVIMRERKRPARWCRVTCFGGHGTPSIVLA